MVRFDLFFILSSILIIQYSDFNTAQTTPSYRYHICYGANYTVNSTFRTNLNLLLRSLSSFNNNSVIRNGYRNATTGQNPPDIAYGSFQCRGDIVRSQLCRNCVDIAAQEIIESDRCTNSKQAIIWYDECMLRYSNETFFSIMQEHPSAYLWNPNNSTNKDQFEQILGGLMDDLIGEAVSNGSLLFATGDRNFTDFQKIYGLVQCTADISSSACNRCLRGAISELPNCCDGKQGGRVIRPSCNFRYEIDPFFQSMVTPAPSPSPLGLPPLSPNTTTTNSKGKNSSKLAVIIVVPLVIALLSTIAIWFFCFRRKKTRKNFDDVDEIQGAESLQFNFSTVSAATDNFCGANKLGEGGFGSVYKGKLSDGQEIAVKRLSENSGQGQQEFKNEVLLVAKLQHMNLVRLLGFCLDGEEKLLIYEYMPNASLDQFLFGLAPVLLSYFTFVLINSFTTENLLVT